MRTLMKVVLVEDEYYVRKGIIRALDWEAHGCFIAGEAENGEKGISLVEETRPQLVIADIEMPMMDGIEMVRRLKAKGISAEYIFLTSHQNFNYVYNAMKMEVIDYLLKPFHPEDLLACIHKARLRLHLDEEEWRKSEREELQVKNALVREAVNYVRAHYAEEISSVSVSLHLNLSTAYFCRIFKKETGYTFGQYLSNYRVQIAAGMLKNFDVRVNEVAAEVGILDSNYFSQIFKRIMGIAPKDYQNLKRYH